MILSCTRFIAVQNLNKQKSKIIELKIKTDCKFLAILLSIFILSETLSFPCHIFNFYLFNIFYGISWVLCIIIYFLNILIFEQSI